MVGVRIFVSYRFEFLLVVQTAHFLETTSKRLAVVFNRISRATSLFKLVEPRFAVKVENSFARRNYSLASAATSRDEAVTMCYCYQGKTNPLYLCMNKAIRYVFPSYFITLQGWKLHSSTCDSLALWGVAHVYNRK
ncbi:hypothetical protein K1T71_009225 [Dendrolimus kikuchii]|uniref:Uncharacterized protein n=1 Tax=Dendrolimus kikuchii TaxID=765133 RepID=A0ACC1CTV9_9NEOP|nr:hypothetical protein K1T71_009225 [Dendrolimus kikuchii]